MEIELSILGDPTPTLRGLLSAYETRTGAQVRLTSIPWEKAWPELLTFALYDRGPDVSHVGSTWASSLVAMNSLRSFKASEVAAWGGREAFLPPCWQSATIPGETEVFSAPWASFTFVICYRRDLLAKAGVSEEMAFQTPETLQETLGRLRDTGVQTPWSVPVDPADPDILHVLASWVWGAGADLVDQDGFLLCSSPRALGALQSYYESLQLYSPGVYPITAPSSEALFTSGRAAVTICGADRPYNWLMAGGAAPQVAEAMGVAVMPGVPWIGGDNLVLWSHTRVQPEKERLAVELVRTLLDEPAQEAQANGEETILPTRPQALATLPLPGSQVTQAVIHSLEHGRAYQTMPLWSKIEHRFGQTLVEIGKKTLRGADVKDTVQQELERLANRLEITLKGT